MAAWTVAVGCVMAERRRELALLGPRGFTGGDLQRLVAIEHIALVGAGLLIVSPPQPSPSRPLSSSAAALRHGTRGVVLPVAVACMLAAFGGREATATAVGGITKSE